MSTSTEEKKRYVLEYIRSLVAIEEAMEPYKEQKRELRTEFREQGWLNTDEIRAAVKAYRLFKGKVNIDDVYDNYKMLSLAVTNGGRSVIIQYQRLDEYVKVPTRSNPSDAGLDVYANVRDPIVI